VLVAFNAVHDSVFVLTEIALDHAVDITFVDLGRLDK